jgi:hypothetical protein
MPIEFQQPGPLFPLGAVGGGEAEQYTKDASERAADQQQLLRTQEQGTDLAARQGQQLVQIAQQRAAQQHDFDRANQQAYIQQWQKQQDLSQGDLLQMQRLQNGLSEIDRLHRTGQISDFEANDLRMQAIGHLSPLQQRYQEQQSRLREQQMQQLQEQAKMEAIHQKTLMNYLNLGPDDKVQKVLLDGRPFALTQTQAGKFQLTPIHPPAGQILDVTKNGTSIIADGTGRVHLDHPRIDPRTLPNIGEHVQRITGRSLDDWLDLGVGWHWDQNGALKQFTVHQPRPEKEEKEEKFDPVKALHEAEAEAKLLNPTARVGKPQGDPNLDDVYRQDVADIFNQKKSTFEARQAAKRQARDSRKQEVLPMPQEQPAEAGQAATPAEDIGDDVTPEGRQLKAAHAAAVERGDQKAIEALRVLDRARRARMPQAAPRPAPAPAPAAALPTYQDDPSRQINEDRPVVGHNF